MHPINDIRSSKSQKLENKRIVLGITGSIAAVECIKLSRELARHGAEVIPVMSEAATRIIHPDSIHFATGNEPIIKLDGRVQHVELCGDSKSRVDLLLIAPATANTISKIAFGIDDTTVTTMATCALGSRMPVIIVPAMHSSMYDHRIIMENIGKLKKLGVKFIGPRLEERKAKIASNDEIISVVARTIGPNDLKKKKVLVITGSTEEKLDDVRYLTNFSSGKTGAEIALATYERGADVVVWAPEILALPHFIKRINFRSTADLMKLAPKANADIIIVPAAISDFSPKQSRGKISSDAESLEIKLARNPKVITELRKHKRAKLVGFKLESGISQAELEKRARKRMKDTGANIIVANLQSDVSSDRTKAIIILRSGKSEKVSGSKRVLADKILDAVLGS